MTTRPRATWAEAESACRSTCPWLDPVDPRKPSVIRLVLTATASQHPAVQDDFRDFVRTLRPDVGAASS